MRHSDHNVMETIVGSSTLRYLGVLTIAVILAACSEAPVSGPTAPSKVGTDLITAPPGHAFISSQGDGTFLTITGPAIEMTATEACGYLMSFHQRLGVRTLPSRPGTSELPTTDTYTSNPIPPGAYPVTFVRPCGVTTIFDVDFSVHGAK